MPKKDQTRWSWKPLPEDLENMEKIRAFIEKATYGAEVTHSQVIRAALKKWTQEIESKSQGG